MVENDFYPACSLSLHTIHWTKRPIPTQMQKEMSQPINFVVFFTQPHVIYLVERSYNTYPITKVERSYVSVYMYAPVKCYMNCPICYPNVCNLFLPSPRMTTRCCLRTPPTPTVTPRPSWSPRGMSSAARRTRRNEDDSGLFPDLCV